MAAFARALLVMVTVASVGVACGQTSRDDADATVPIGGEGGVGGGAGAPQAGTSGSQATAGVGGAEAGCIAFCTARQIHIQHCTKRDGAVALRETLEECVQSAEAVQFGLCPADPACGGWLAGCLSDAGDVPSVEHFPPDNTCADSVAAGLFRPQAP